MLVETVKTDELIATNAHTATVETVQIGSGSATLERGTVLARANTSSDYVMLGSATTGKAEAILAKDVTQTSSDAVVGLAYVSGDFKTSKLKVEDEYTMTEADRLNLKNAGIYLVNGID